MPSFTRQAIMDAFLRLLHHRPFRKVTVRDIVEECGVNRTTFYYYYQDIYAIVEDILAGALTPYVNAMLGFSQADDLRDVSDFLRMHRPALQGLWSGMEQVDVRRYIFAVMDEPIRRLIAEYSMGDPASGPEEEATFLLMREALIGIFRLYLFEEMPVDFLRLAEAAHGTVFALLANLREGNENE